MVAMWLPLSGILLACLANGCATQQAEPPAVVGPQGTVLFYGSVEAEVHHRAEGITVREVTAGKPGPRYSVLLIDKSQAHLLPKVSRAGQGYFQKIACAPGRHLFRLEKGPTQSQVEVEVAEGMISTVEVTMSVIGRDDVTSPERVFFVLSAAPERPAKPPVQAFGRVFE